MYFLYLTLKGLQGTGGKNSFAKKEVKRTAAAECGCFFLWECRWEEGGLRRSTQRRRGLLVEMKRETSRKLQRRERRFSLRLGLQSVSCDPGLL